MDDNARSGGAPWLVDWKCARTFRRPRDGRVVAEVPPGETGAGRFDSLDPTTFRYTLAATELTPA
jgi:hypothetical protein